MGQTGPIPNRSDQRVRRTKDEFGPITKIEAQGTVEVPALDLDDPHPLIVDLYRSLANSAQAKYYLPSD